MTSTVWTVEKGRAVGLARAVDYLELTKPKIAVLVLTTVAVVGVVAGGVGERPPLAVPLAPDRPPNL